MTDLSYEAHGLDWLISEFVGTVPGVAHALVASWDGIPLAVSSRLPADRAERLAAITCGLVSLTSGAAHLLEGGAVVQAMVEMQQGVMLAMAISDGSCLAALASPGCDLALVAYHMTLMVERAGDVLTPALRAHLLTSSPVKVDEITK
ncbi:roadblock/LC7 domain-containing protein [Nonomuraea rhizosphaerae]|uniref:roadblock/LC7 domain-containing protein n=1 Tax=Nonomuraea rhizosphaerae TaxID=2665663 RepID=UPI001C5D28DA|nr:roadblock/LC7 domain-containing protein [Nonomuraea rhizosphaerae]